MNKSDSDFEKYKQQVMATWGQNNTTPFDIVLRMTSQVIQEGTKNNGKE